MTQENIMLSIKGVNKSFGGLKALQNVSLEVKKDTIYGLIGPNGAGKTTFFNVITGLYEPDSGEFILNGTHYEPTEVHEVAKAGIARTFQNIRLFGNMTALENVMIGRHVRTKGGVLGSIFGSKAVRQEEADIKARAMALLEYVGVGQYHDYLAKNMAYGLQRRLEIARALATEPKLLALDEPAAGMNSTEKLDLTKLLKKISNDGTTILIIEHDVKLIMELCDEMTVLNYGEILVQGKPEVVRNNEEFISAYLGGH